MSRILLTLLFILLAPATAFPLVIKGNTVWQGKVVIKEDVVVLPGAILTIKAGTEVIVRPSETTNIDPEFISPQNEIMVRGRLNAEGTLRRPVVFHGQGKGGTKWGGIVIASSAAVDLEQVEIRDARAAVWIIDGRLAASDSLFTANRYGIVGVSARGRARISGSRITGNDYGVMRFSGAGIDLRDTTIKGNSKEDEVTRTVGRVMPSVQELKPAAEKNGPQWSYKSEVLAGDTVWRGRVLVDGLLRIPDNARLIILPGTVVEFSFLDKNGDGIGESGLQVQGGIIAKGTPDAPIVFRSAARKKQGSWDAINILGSDRARNLIEYCLVENAYRGLHLHYANVGVSHAVFRDNFRGAQFQESLVSFDHVGFFNNFSAIQARDSELEFVGNDLFDNVNGANFFRLNLKARNNTFANNLLDGLRIREGVAVVKTNRISGNRFGLSLSDVYSGSFSANVITDNLEAGILCRGVDNIEISANIVSGNGIDGMRLVRSRAVVAANLINANLGQGLRLDRFNGVIRDNNIVDNRRYAIGVDGPVGVDAAENWWGGDDPAAVISDGDDKDGVGKVSILPVRNAPMAVPWPLVDIRGKARWAGEIIVAADPMLTVVKGARLDITPGTVVGFEEGAGLKVYGDLVARGREGERIRFTGRDGRKPGSWGEVSIERSLGSAIENCDFQYATWGLHCHFVPVRISGCRFVDNDGGIRFRSGPMDIKNNLFRDNRIGIRGFRPAVLISGNLFDRNEIAIFVREGGHGAVINNNNFVQSGRYDIRLGDFNTEDVDTRRNYFDHEPLLFDDRREPGIGRVILAPGLTRPEQVGPWR